MVPLVCKHCEESRSVVVSHNWIFSRHRDGGEVQKDCSPALYLRTAFASPISRYGIVLA